MKRVDYFPVFISILFLLLVTLPYLMAFHASNGDYVFGGAFLGLQDTNSYLAKMYQGWSGSWRFTLPYTSEPGQGAYINLFYIALGHIARQLGLSLLFVYHLVRIIGAGFLAFSVWLFYREIFEDRFTRRLAFLIAMLGAGMGWLVLAVGYQTVDFWVAEAYPFLSSFVNPHFPIGLALVLLLLLPRPNANFISWQHVFLFFCALLLGIINPFGIVIVIVILAGLAVLALIEDYSKTRNFPQAFLNSPMIRCLFWISLGGLPVLIYDLLAIRLDPQLSGWNQQNQTPAPPFWDLFISFSPLLILAIFAAFRLQKHSHVVILVVWLVLAIAIIYLPFSLQRRFMMGLYIPIAGLAALSLSKIRIRHPNAWRIPLVLVFIMILPTNGLILMASVSETRNYSERIYLTSADSNALQWINLSTSPDSIILASPQMGSFIPAITGRGVIYGHWCETIDAEREYNTIMQYFSGNMTTEQKLQFYQARSLDYLYYGPLEQKIGPLDLAHNLQLVYHSDGVSIYQITPPP